MSDTTCQRDLHSEPITEEWLKANGFTQQEFFNSPSLRADFGPYEVIVRSDEVLLFGERSQWMELGRHWVTDRLVTFIEALTGKEWPCT